MIKTKKNSKILNIIIMFILLPMLALSCFVQVLNKPKMVVSANTVIKDYTFEGSDLYLPFTIFDNNHQPLRNLDGSFKTAYVRIKYTLSKSSPSTNSVNIDYSFHGMYYLEATPSASVSEFTYYPCEGSGHYIIDHQQNLYLPFKFYDIKPSSTTGDWFVGYLNIYVFANNGDDTGFSKFNNNVYKITEGSDARYVDNYYDGGNQVKYYDEFDNSVCLSGICYYTYDEENNPFYYLSYYFPGLEDRTYYTNAILTDNEAYNSGLQSGYNNGFSAGSSSGYTDGFSAGKIEGYNNGYTAGVENSNNYSFLSLIGAVVDAPISAFTSLLNFNLLGVNLLAFFTGLLTLAIIIFIIKLVLGGK